MLIVHKDLRNSYDVAFSVQKDKLQLVFIFLREAHLISIVWKRVYLMKQGAPRETLEVRIIQ